MSGTGRLTNGKSGHMKAKSQGDSRRDQRLLKRQIPVADQGTADYEINEDVQMQDIVQEDFANSVPQLATVDIGLRNEQYFQEICGEIALCASPSLQNEAYYRALCGPKTTTTTKVCVFAIFTH